MNDNIQCDDCGFGFPKYHLQDGLCYTCREYEKELENTMTDFPEEFYKEVESKQFKNKECANVLFEIDQITNETKRFQFNQQSNFLYHFVNKFTDTEVSIEAIREELRNLMK